MRVLYKEHKKIKKENLMNNYMKLTFPVLLLVASCGGEKPTKYIFDINEMQDNIATYKKGDEL